MPAFARDDTMKAFLFIYLFIFSHWKVCECFLAVCPGSSCAVSRSLSRIRICPLGHAIKEKGLFLFFCVSCITWFTRALCQRQGRNPPRTPHTGWSRSHNFTTKNTLGVVLVFDAVYNINSNGRVTQKSRFARLKPHGLKKDNSVWWALLPQTRRADHFGRKV